MRVAFIVLHCTWGSGLNRLNLTSLWDSEGDVDSPSGTRRIDRKGKALGGHVTGAPLSRDVGRLDTTSSAGVTAPVFQLLLLLPPPFLFQASFLPHFLPSSAGDGDGGCTPAYLLRCSVY
jgi:hypothetical protein